MSGVANTPSASVMTASRSDIRTTLAPSAAVVLAVVVVVDVVVVAVVLLDVTATTRTRTVAVAVLPDASLAVYVTVYSPSASVLMGRSLMCATSTSPLQRSVAVKWSCV